MTYDYKRDETEKYIIGHLLTGGKKARDTLEKFSIDNADFFLYADYKILFNGILQAYRYNKIPTLLNIAQFVRASEENKFLLTENYSNRLIEANAIDCTVNLSGMYSLEYILYYFVELILKEFWRVESVKMSNDDLVIEDVFEFADDIIDRYKDLENHLMEGLKDGDGFKSISEEETYKREKALSGGLNNPPHYLDSIQKRTGGFIGSELTILAGRPGMGKCLGKGTKVLMYDGSIKKVEDVKVGDQLMGDDSTPRNVLSLARGREEMYWIRQNNGIDYRVNKSHILSLKKSRSEGSLNKGDVLNISVEDYLTKSNKFKSNFKGYKVDVEFDEKPLEIDPYYIGIWLGDGTSSSSAITTEDPEVIDYIESYANKLGLKFTPCYPTIGTPRYSINGVGKNFQQNCFVKKLRDMNLLNNKHIPKDYLINSKKNRLRLLAGLIDSDGHYQEKYNSFEIVQKNKELSEQIFFLCNSLGFKTSFRKKIATLKSRDYSCEVYRIRISGNLDIIPTLVKRKQARKRKGNIDWRVGGIKVEYDKIDDYYGFEIDGNKLFLLEDMTVTHNTTVALILSLFLILENNMKVSFFSLEMPKLKLINKVVSWKTKIPYSKIRDYTTTDEEWKQIIEWYDYFDHPECPLKIFTSTDFNSIKNRIKETKPDIAIIDYLQLITTKLKFGNREQEVAYFSKSLKTTCNKENIPIIALSQLNRSVESRANKRPGLSDLRESGSLEQDADCVVFLYREAYYKEQSGDYYPPYELWNTEWIEAKNRMSGPFTERVNINLVDGTYQDHFKEYD